MRPEKTSDNEARCTCPGCPTYNKCMDKGTEVLYCTVGATACELERKGCLCGECPVWRDNGLTTFYFCVHGAAEE